MIGKLKALLLVRRIRIWVGRVRLFYYVRLRRRLKTLGSEEAFETTLKHNLKSLKIFGMRRMARIIKPLVAIETVDASSRVLVIGPRNEDDLLLLAGEGLGWDNVQGCDLISYSPKIALGDMHRLPYDDHAWDVAICGWTLSYSREPAQLAAELLRVTKPGGLICIGLEYSELSAADTEKLLGYTIADRGFERINSVQQVLDLFGGRVGHVYFSHDAPARRSHRCDGLVRDPSSVVVIFSTTGVAGAPFAMDSTEAPAH